VLDIGASSLRAGYAGDDAPKAVIPSSYGFIEEPQTEGGDVSMSDGTDASKAPRNAKLFIGQNGPSLWREGMNIRNPIEEGISASTHPR
jgi:actin-like protein 6B